MGPVSIGVEVQRNTDGDTPSRVLGDNVFVFLKSNLFALLLLYLT